MRTNMVSMNTQYTWQKKGKIGYGQLPFVDLLDEYTARIYYTYRDCYNQSLIGYQDVESKFPQKILSTHTKPVLSLGKVGSFDEHGTMGSCIVTVDENKYLYYTGWRRLDKNYSLGIGLAINGIKQGVVISPSIENHFLCCSPFVIHENPLWQMWYISGKGLGGFSGNFALYSMHYAESWDGIKWSSKDVRFENNNEIFARPFVKKDNGYKMWYPKMVVKLPKSYRIGYAESDNGIFWTREDYKSGIDISKGSWDSEMVSFPWLYYINETEYMLYSGNNFGKEGMGYATRKIRV